MPKGLLEAVVMIVLRLCRASTSVQELRHRIDKYRSEGPVVLRAGAGWNPPEPPEADTAASLPELGT